MLSRNLDLIERKQDRNPRLSALRLCGFEGEYSESKSSSLVKVLPVVTFLNATLYGTIISASSSSPYPAEIMRTSITPCPNLCLRFFTPFITLRWPRPLYICAAGVSNVFNSRIRSGRRSGETKSSHVSWFGGLCFFNAVQAVMTRILIFSSALFLDKGKQKNCWRLLVQDDIDSSVS